MDKNINDFSLKSVRQVRSGPESVFSRVVRGVRSILLSGRFSVGDKFFSERRLSEELGINRMTLRSVLAYFEKEGFFQRTVNGQRIVSAIPSNNAVNNSLVFLTLAKFSSNVIVESGWSVNIAFGAVDAALRTDRNMLIISKNCDEKNALAELLINPPAGIVLDVDVSDAQIECARGLASKGVPVVCIENPVVDNCDIVRSNHERGGYELVRWLISRGRKNFAIVYNNREVFEDKIWWNDRLKGYLRALDEFGIAHPLEINVKERELDSLNVSEKRLFELRTDLHAASIVEALKNKSIDAVLSISDGFVPLIIAALRKIGYSVHEEIAVAGYDNYWSGVWKTCIGPDDKMYPIATIDKKNHIIGESACKILLERIDGKLCFGRQKREIEPELVIINRISK